MQKFQLIDGAKTAEKYPLITATSHKCPFLLNKPGIKFNVVGEIYNVGDADDCVFFVWYLFSVTWQKIP